MTHYFIWLRDKEKNILLTNYLLLLYAFFLPISYVIAGDIMIAIAIMFFSSPNVKEKIMYAMKDNIVLSLFLFFSVYVLWMIGSDNIDIALYEIKNLQLLLFPIIFISVIKQEFIKKILSAFLLSLSISIILSYGMYFDLINSPFRLTSDPLPFLYKSDYGFFLVIFLCYSLFKLLKDKSAHILVKLFYGLFLLLGSINLFFSGSQSAEVYYIPAIFVVIIFHYRALAGKILITSMVFITALYIFAYKTIDTFHTRANATVSTISKAFTDDNFNSSEGARYGMILYSLPIIGENLFFGLGTGDHAVQVLHEIKQSVEHKVADDPTHEKLIREKYTELIRALSIGKSSFLHNGYLQALVEFGIIGLIIYLNIFYSILKYKQTNDDLRLLQLTLVTAYMIMAIAGADFQFNSTGTFFIFIISLTLNLYNSRNSVISPLSESNKADKNLLTNG